MSDDGFDGKLDDLIAVLMCPALYTPPTNELSRYMLEDLRNEMRENVTQIRMMLMLCEHSLLELNRALRVEDDGA